MKGLNEFLEQSPLLKNETIVLEKTENSELVEVLKPCNKDFFERVFSPTGPYWQTYVELGFGETPFKAKHLAVVNERMYFCRNVEKRFLYSVGPKKNFYYQNHEVKEKIKPSLENFLLLLSAPFNFAKQVASVSLASIRINEELKNFTVFSEQTKKFWKNSLNPNINNHLQLSAKALEGAILSMKYSFYASLAYSLKTKLKNSNGWLECELENFSKLSAFKQSEFLEKAKELFGFYSKNPYDISIPRFNENPKQALEFSHIKFPLNPAARWRENAKFLCARYLAVLRKCYLDFGEKTSLKEKVFYLKHRELSTSNDLASVIEQREKEFKESCNALLPNVLVFDGKWNIETTTQKKKTKRISSSEQIKGIPAGGQRVVIGEAVLVDGENDYKKDLQGKIVFSKTLSPNLTILFDKIAGIVSAGGGRVAHTAVVAVEQEMPCIVQTKNFDLIKEGDRIRVNGFNGKIEKLPDFTN